ncbi:5-deoxy-glucuronate isomerase [Demetria terragena]|uniref:5-deoxy-glucuronate isomerase n=1 Tax=Demetria terragena TaxID=63959 RepID=UPI000382BE63|nr:5-deoxy-glucuronate isomerase [Demetria terragena]
MSGLGQDNARWVIPRGTAAHDGFDVVVDDRREGWKHTGLRVWTAVEGETVTISDDGFEHIVVPLTGPVRVTATDVTGETSSVDLVGRTSVFAGPTDVAYVPAGSALTLTGIADGARIAVCAAAVEHPSGQEFRHLPASQVPVELRGAGVASREVRNFGQPNVLDADQIIACEVITPAGNWSSYPPHKHDEARPGEETELEEIYYFEVQTQDGSDHGDPVGYQRVYGTESRPIDVLAEVHTGDVVLVPHGWHGPATAPPGYDLYYLNVMAGPGDERAWLICDDPNHGWVRDAWGDQEIDPRLPLGGKS